MTISLRSTIAEISGWADDHRSAATMRQKLRDCGCLIYGAGGFGREVLAVLQAKAIPVRGFVDAFSGGQPVAGLPCHRPEAIATDLAARSALIMAVNNFKTPVDEAVAWARAAGFAEIVFVAELPDVLAPSLGHYWQGSRRLMRDSTAQLERFHGLLRDARSRDILEALVRFRVTGKPDHHPPVDREHQYFPEDLPLPIRSIRVVDCGAFPGDMLQSTRAAGLMLEAWYAFEPDPSNFQHLCKVASEASFGGALFPCGVGDKTGQIRFSDGSEDASRILVGDGTGAGGVAVPVVRIDDVLRAPGIDMVKLDVEGFEAAAIDGMLGLLDRDRPRLAVAIYHKPTDLWEIAFKVEAAFPETRFAIRQHGHNGYDTVLYADLPPRD